MARQLVNMVVKNIAAVEHPANKRSFLIIKSAKVKKNDEAMTFDDAMFGRRLNVVYQCVGDCYSALMETIDSIRYSKEEDKPTAVKAAMTGYLNALQKMMPDMLAELDAEYDDMEKGALDPASLVKLQGRVETLIKEITMTDVKKAPDASMLQKMANGIALLFGQASGADAATITELEKAAGGVKTPEVPAEITARLQKSEADAAELRKSNEELAKTVAKLHEDAELRKFAEEVSDYKALGLDPAKDAAMLKSVSEKLGPTEAARIREVFKSAMAQIAAGKLFGEVGSQGGGNIAGSVAEEVEQKVGAILSKDANKMTPEQARDSVFRADRSLYDRWREETSVKI